MLELVDVRTPEQLDLIRRLFSEYGASLGVDLSFQNFSEELATLPGRYVPPEGGIVLAIDDGNPAGCVAFRNLEAGTCEMKRLYVRPEFRGRRIGHALAEAVILKARNAGYHEMRLDTLPSMHTAIAMYESLGFRPAEAYYVNPVPGTRYYTLRFTR